MSFLVEIHVQGHLTAEWAGIFDGMEITCLPGGNTRLSGCLQDQPALYGLLIRLRDLGITLVSMDTTSQVYGLHSRITGHSERIFTLNTQYYIDCINEGKRLYTRMLGKARGLILHEGEIGWLESDPHGGPEYIFDINITTGDVEKRVDDMILAIQAGELPGYILISPLSKPHNLVEKFQAHGFLVNFDDGSGMALDLTPAIQRVALPPGIRVLPVEDETALATWVDIVNEALFGGVLISYDQYCDMYRLENVHMNLGYVDNAPAATSLVIYSDQKRVATVEQISTLKAYRCRGLGTAITVASLQQMQHEGVQTVVLHATKASEPMYQKIGFTGYFNVMEVVYPGKS